MRRPINVLLTAVLVALPWGTATAQQGGRAEGAARSPRNPIQNGLPLEPTRTQHRRRTL